MSNPPKLQIHIITPVVVHNITNYKVAEISVIEVAAMMLLQSSKIVGVCDCASQVVSLSNAYFYPLYDLHFCWGGW